MVKYLFFIVLFFCSVNAWGQIETDSLPPTDTVVSRPVIRVHRADTSRFRRPVKDTIVHANYIDSIPRLATPPASNDSFLFSGHSFFRFTNPVRLLMSRRVVEGKESIFYMIMALVIFFALIRNGFYRYLLDLFRTFFQTTLQQRQIKEQLLQSPLPSLLMNIFFIVSAGMYATLLLQHFGLGGRYSFFQLYGYCAAGLIAIYGVKYFTLKFLGWIVQGAHAVNTYIFVVFSTNKVIGIALIPFIILLAFSHGDLNQVAFSLSLVVLGLLFIYRYLLSYLSLQRQVEISFFHFLIYLTAFEIAPVLLINKLLLRIFA